MTTTTTLMPKKEQKIISWGLPGQEETLLQDFRDMIAEAERGKGYTFDEYTNKVNQWLRNNL